MAAPIKQFADYYPHGAGERSDERCLALRRKFGIEGYGVHCMMQEVLTGKPGYRWKWTTLSLELLAGDMGIEPGRLIKILEYMVVIELYSRDKEYLWSDDLIANFASLMERRRQQREAKARKSKKKVVGGDNENQGDEVDQVGRENPENNTKSAAKTQEKGDGFFCPEQVGGENSYIEQSRADKHKEEKQKKTKSKAEQPTTTATRKPETNATPTEPTTGNAAAGLPDPAPPGLQGDKPPDRNTSDERSQRLIRRAGLFDAVCGILGFNPATANSESTIRSILAMIDRCGQEALARGTRFEVWSEELKRLALRASQNAENPVGYWLSVCAAEFNLVA